MNLVEGLYDSRCEHILRSQEEAVQSCLQGEVGVDPVTVDFRILQKDKFLKLLHMTYDMKYFI